MSDRFDLDLLDDEDPFEIDAQAAHLFKHPHLGIDDIHDVWPGDPLFYPAIGPAHWLMCAEVDGRVSCRAAGALSPKEPSALSPDRLL
ncbi:MAG: hypothetical protein ACRDMX_11680 [Solirubrobacteraceae bacterium]